MAGSIFERDSLAGVVQPAGILTGEGNAVAVSGLESIAILNDDGVLAGRQLEVREGKVNPVGESYQVQIDDFVSDIGQFDEFFVRLTGIGQGLRMIHDLGDTEVLRDRADGEDRLTQGAPRAAVEYTSLGERAVSQDNRIGELVCAGEIVVFRAIPTQEEFRRDQEVSVRDGSIQAVNGQEIAALV